MLTIKTHLKSLVTSSLYLSNVGTLVAAKHPLKGADGVVVSSYRLFIPNGFDNRWLETTTPSAPNKERDHFSLSRSRPFFAKKGITRNNFLIDCVSMPARVFRHRITMRRDTGLPPGTLDMLVLRVLATDPLHGYAIAQRIHLLSSQELSVEEGSLYPALQKLLLKGWVKATPAVSETGRQVREYRITAAGRKQLELELNEYRRVTHAISTLLDNA